MFKSLPKNKKRTDILTGVEADEFARLHTAIYNGGDASTMIGFINSNYGLLKSAISDKYYIVELGEVLNFEGLDSFARVERIRPEALTLNLVPGQNPSEAFNGYNFFDVATISPKTGKPETLYFSNELMPFKSYEDRCAYEQVIHDVYFPVSRFEAFNELTDYLTDDNFVIATKDRFRENIYETEFEAGLIEGKILLYRANKALDEAVKKARQGTMNK